MTAGLAGTVEAEGTRCIVPATGSAAGDTACVLTLTQPLTSWRDYFTPVYLGFLTH